MSAGSKPLRPWQVCAGDVIGSGKRVEYVFERYGELYINASDEELVRQGKRTYGEELTRLYDLDLSGWRVIGHYGCGRGYEGRSWYDMGKQYAILRVQKCKGAAIGAMQYHNDREPGKHTNPDIDQTRTRLNREMRSHVDYEREVQARIDDGYSGERKVRKDAVKLVEGIVTASPEFFELADDDKVREFFDDAYRFCCDEFGESNMVHFTVHMDEETPHAHFGFVPLRDGKLSWKEFFPNKMALGKMQDRFYGRVGALYGLSRGEKRGDGEPVKRHKSVAEYKAENLRIQAELDEKTKQLEAAREELASTRAQLAECRSQVEGFAARFERIKVELAQIAEALSWRKSF